MVANDKWNRQCSVKSFGKSVYRHYISSVNVWHLPPYYGNDTQMTFPFACGSIKTYANLYLFVVLNYSDRRALNMERQYKFQTVNASRSKRKRLDNRVRKIDIAWASDKVDKLIENVQRYEALWDVTQNAYKDRDMRTQNWKAIAESLEIDAAQCKVKWNSLRTSFNVRQNMAYIRLTCKFSYRKSIFSGWIEEEARHNWRTRSQEIESLSPSDGIYWAHFDDGSRSNHKYGEYLICDLFMNFLWRQGPGVDLIVLNDKIVFCSFTFSQSRS